MSQSTKKRKAGKEGVLKNSPETSSIKVSLGSILLPANKRENLKLIDQYAKDMHAVRQEAYILVQILHSLIASKGWRQVYHTIPYHTIPYLTYIPYLHTILTYHTYIPYLHTILTYHTYIPYHTILTYHTILGLSTRRHHV
jgi:NADH:ubiquinone oxidoreductase subunit E